MPSEFVGILGLYSDIMEKKLEASILQGGIICVFSLSRPGCLNVCKLVFAFRLALGSHRPHNSSFACSALLEDVLEKPDQAVGRHPMKSLRFKRLLILGL